MVKYYCYILFAIFISLCSTTLHAETPSVYSRVDSQTVHIGEAIHFDVVIEGADSQSTPELIGGDGFELAFLGTQSSVNILNGTTTQKSVFSYQITPKEKGLLTTPIAEVQVDGTVVRTKPLSIKVLASSPSKLSSATSPVFLRQEVRKKRVYVGEQLPLSLNLFHSVDVLEANFVDLRFDKFWVESLGKERLSRKQIKGKSYTLHEIGKALFPLSPGTVEITPKSIQVRYRSHESRRRDMLGFGSRFFEGMFGGRTKTQTLHSNPATVEVLPLPPQPKNFPNLGLTQAIVGLTSVSVGIDEDPVEVGEGKTLEIVIESEGNLSALKELPLKVAGAKSYEESPETRTMRRENRLVTQKTFRYSLIPTGSGDLELPPIRIGYFDPDSKKYQTIETEPKTIRVEGQGLVASKSRNNLIESQANLSQEALLAEDALIERYSEESFLKKLSSQVSIGLALLMIFGTTLLIFAVWLAYIFLNQRFILRRYQNQVLGAADHRQLRKSFEQFLAHRFLSDYPTSDRLLRQELASREIENDLRHSIEVVFDQMDHLQFARLTEEEREAVFKQVKSEAESLVQRCS